MKIKRILMTIGIFLSLAISTYAGTLQNFTTKNTYNGKFKDVVATEWYVNDVKVCYELGLMNGKSATKFGVNDNVTIAEAITMASRVHNIYNGSQTVIEQEEGDNWYVGAVNYAVENGIIKSNDFSQYDKSATRAEVAYIFSNSLPKENFTKINSIEKIPDVTTSTKYYNNIIDLYNSGILTGNDTKGTFAPNTNIIRVEACAIINRVAVEQNRKTFTLADTKTANSESVQILKTDINKNVEQTIELINMQNKPTETVIDFSMGSILRYITMSSTGAMNSELSDEEKEQLELMKNVRLKITLNRDNSSKKAKIITELYSNSDRLTAQAAIEDSKLYFKMPNIYDEYILIDFKKTQEETDGDVQLQNIVFQNIFKNIALSESDIKYSTEVIFEGDIFNLKGTISMTDENGEETEILDFTMTNKIIDNFDLEIKGNETEFTLLTDEQKAELGEEIMQNIQNNQDNKLIKLLIGELQQ